MIRALTFAALLAFAAPALAAADWTTTVSATPKGVLIGNPQAKLKLVEYGSFTCPHCRAFHTDGYPALKSKYIASGRLSFEFRSFVRNGPDYAASLLVACTATPARQVANIDLLFDRQPDWIKGFEDIDEATAKTLAATPKERQVAALAKAGKLTAFMAAHGLPAATAERCLADKAAADRLTATLKTAVETDHVEGTPGFLLNGVIQTSNPLVGFPHSIASWAELEPKLAEALR